MKSETGLCIKRQLQRVRRFRPEANDIVNVHGRAVEQGSRTVLLSVSILPKFFAFCSSSAAMAIWSLTVSRSCVKFLMRF